MLEVNYHINIRTCDKRYQISISYCVDVVIHSFRYWLFITTCTHLNKIVCSPQANNVVVVGFGILNKVPEEKQYQMIRKQVCTKVEDPVFFYTRHETDFRLPQSCKYINSTSRKVFSNHVSFCLHVDIIQSHGRCSRLSNRTQRW